VPTVLLPPTTPFTFHVTDWLVEFLTEAVNCCARFVPTVTFVGETVTLMGWGGAAAVTVTVEVPNADGVALLAACTVTVAGEGTVEGAV
jgi:hypothetical protein